jgi:zeta-carotene desaturase
VVERFWRQVLVSAINEELDRMAASHGFQVFGLAFLGTSESYQMGVPQVPLGALYDAAFWKRWGNVRLHFRQPVTSLTGSAGYVVVAVPFERVAAIIPGYQPPAMEHSPITGIHLWFDRSVTDLPHATLLDSPLQWVFNKGAGRHLQVVVSASRDLTAMSRGDVVDLAVRDLSEYFPAVKTAALLRSRVVKEVRATFSALPGLSRQRPSPRTHLPNVFVAGDWTQTGWPSTMEGAVRSGYAAAEAVAAAEGQPRRFLVPEINSPLEIPR